MLWRAATFLLVAWGVFAASLMAPRLADELASGQLGTPGFTWKAASGFLTHECVVLSVTPGSSADAVGLKPGDIFAFNDHALTLLMPGEFGQVTRFHPDGSSEQITVPIDGAKAPFGYLLRRALYPGFLLFIALAALVAWRGARDMPERALALSLALYGQTSAYQYFTTDELRLAGQFVWTCSLSTAPFCLAIFVTSYVRRRAGGATSYERPLWLAASLSVATATILFTVFRLRFYMDHWIYAVPQYAAVLLSAALGMLFLRHGWRMMTGEDRQRLRWIALAFVALLTGDLVGAIPITIWNAVWLVGVAAYVAKLIGALLLVYATLRHRVVDFGFALNRATVLGATSLLLVGLFAALTALADRLLRFDGASDRNWIDIAITFGLAIIATRLRKLVEQWVERLLFRAWRAREQALQDFLQRAANFTRPDTLLDALVEALDKFAGRSAASVLLQKDGAFVAIRDPSFQPLDLDDPLVVELRTQRRAVRLAEPRHGAVLALPMSQGGALFGFVLLAARADGDLYRPDEIALLQSVVREVGFELQALQAASLAPDAVTAILNRLDALEGSLHGRGKAVQA